MSPVREQHDPRGECRACHPVAEPGQARSVARALAHAHLVEVRPLADQRLLLPAWALTCRSCSPGVPRLLWAWHDPARVVAAIRTHDQDPAAQPDWLPLLRA